MSGEAFEFTPGGVVPLKDDGQSQGQPIAPGIAAGGAALEAARAQQSASTAQPPVILQREFKHDHITPATTKSEQPERLNRREWRKELQTRLKVVQREIKRLRSLEDEEAELKRLIAAAKQPPAKVTRIDSARRSS